MKTVKTLDLNARTLNADPEKLIGVYLCGNEDVFQCVLIEAENEQDMDREEVREAG